LLFPDIFHKPAVLQFDQRLGSSDGGAVLLKAADRRYGLIRGLARCLRDKRQAGDPVLHRGRYRMTPDRDAPLWKVHSQVIYWWTGTKVDRDQAYYITNNGYIQLVPKRIAPGSLAFRCVCEPSKRNFLPAGQQ
jgi:hypothetical protein